MNESLDGGGGSGREREDAAHGGPDAFEQILGRGGNLGQHEAALMVEGHDVGEGAADVDADLHGPILARRDADDELGHHLELVLRAFVWAAVFT